MMVQTFVPCVASFNIRIHYVIYPSVFEDFSGKILVLCLVYYQCNGLSHQIVFEIQRHLQF